MQQVQVEEIEKNKTTCAPEKMIDIFALGLILFTMSLSKREKIWRVKVFIFYLLFKALVAKNPNERPKALKIVSELCFLIAKPKIINPQQQELFQQFQIEMQQQNISLSQSYSGFKIRRCWSNVQSEES